MTGGVFAILDDIAMLLDDAAVMSKLAAKKTAGLLGDDLAVNAEKATGFRASRELPVLWAITRGSFINKLIILPLAFLLSAYASWLIVPILLLGGCYLSYEGVEKIFHVFTHHQKKERPAAEVTQNKDELLKKEKAKISSAVRTDFILSIEIIMIALGTVMEQNLILQIMVVSTIAIIATVGVYGLVALIVRMDDAGFFLINLSQKTGQAAGKTLRWCGSGLVAALPHVIRALGFIGTLAMLLVGGGMFTHNIHAVHDLLAFMPALLADFLAGIIVGTVLVAVQLAISRVRGSHITR